ncbi:Cysteine protease XCP2, partial [Cucurbita argyrosperma subsp. sororia]
MTATLRHLVRSSISHTYLPSYTISTFSSYPPKKKDSMSKNADWTKYKMPKYVEWTEDSIPKYVNWRKEGAVTSVKKQWHPASCWIYTGIAAIESAYKIKKGQLIDLSTNQLIHHFRLHLNSGEGGDVDLVFQYAMKTPILRQSDYGKRVVKRDQTVQIRRFQYLRLEEELDLIMALRNGPVCILIASTHHDFEVYRGGIYHGPFGWSVDHSVLAVGYTPDYIIIKNCWGTSWGDKGYMNLSRKALKYSGIFNSWAAYPVV